MLLPLLIWRRKYLLGYFGFMCSSLLTAVKKICFLKNFSGKHQRSSFSTSSSFDKNTGRHGIIKKKYGHIVVCVFMYLCVRVCVFEADVPKKCKAAAGVWGCWKGKAQSPKIFLIFFI